MRYTQVYIDRMQQLNDSITQLERMISLVRDDRGFRVLEMQVRLEEPTITDSALALGRVGMTQDLQRALAQLTRSLEELMENPEFEPSPIPPGPCRNNIPRRN